MDELWLSVETDTISIIANSKEVFESLMNSGLNSPKISIIIDSPEPIIVREPKAKITVRGNSKVFLRGNSRIEATENAVIYAYETSYVDASGSAVVELQDAARALADTSVRVIPRGFATMVRKGGKIAYTHVGV